MHISQLQIYTNLEIVLCSKETGKFIADSSLLIYIYEYVTGKYNNLCPLRIAVGYALGGNMDHPQTNCPFYQQQMLLITEQRL